jgi:hypothetical protein
MCAASVHVGQDAPREYGRAAHPQVGLAKRWQKRGRHPKVDGGRTSPCAGAIPSVLAYGERHTVCSSRRPIMRYPSPAAASTWRRAQAEGAGFAPSTSAHAGRLDIPPRHLPVLEPPWCQEAPKGECSSAAGVIPGTLRASPRGHGSRAHHNDGDAGSPRARYGAGTAG